MTEREMLMLGETGGQAVRRAGGQAGRRSVGPSDHAAVIGGRDAAVAIPLWK